RTNAVWQTRYYTYHRHNSRVTKQSPGKIPAPRSSGIAEHPEVSNCAPSQRGQGVSPFQRRNDPVGGMNLRYLPDSFRDPCVITFHKIQGSKIIVGVSVKAGRNK